MAIEEANTIIAMIFVLRATGLLRLTVSGNNRLLVKKYFLVRCFTSYVPVRPPSLSPQPHTSREVSGRQGLNPTLQDENLSGYFVNFFHSKMITITVCTFIIQIFIARLLINHYLVTWHHICLKYILN